MHKLKMPFIYICMNQTDFSVSFPFLFKYRLARYLFYTAKHIYISNGQHILSEITGVLNNR